MRKYISFLGIPFIVILVTIGCETFKKEAIIYTSDEAALHSFGQAFSVSGEYLIVGASDTNSGQGHVSVFKNNGNSWNEIAQLKASDKADKDLFGYSVSVFGKRAIVGAPGRNSESGQAYIFEENDAGHWREAAILTSQSPEPINKHYFGCSVSIYGDYAIVGANSIGKDTGSAYVFKNDGADHWKKIGEFGSRDKIPGDNFGYCVSMSKNHAIIGAPSAGNGGKNRGQAYILKRDGADNWKEIALLTSSDQADDDYFGRSVSIYGDYAIIGAPLSDSGGNDRGQAYIFKNDGADNWTESAIIKPVEQFNDVFFGHSVSAFGNHVIVGAPGFQAKNGQIYIFENDWMNNWKETDILKPSDQTEKRGFGVNVSIFKEYAVTSAIVATSDGSGRGQVYIFH